MATASSAGFMGQVYISKDGGTTYLPIGECRDGTVTITQEEIEATSFDSQGWKENIVGLKSWEMSMEALYINQSFAGNSGQINVQNSLLDGQIVKWRLLPKTGSGNVGYEGNGMVTNFEVSMTVDDAVTLAIDVMGTGFLEVYTVT